MDIRSFFGKRKADEQKGKRKSKATSRSRDYSQSHGQDVCSPIELFAFFFRADVDCSLESAPRNSNVESEPVAPDSCSDVESEPVSPDSELRKVRNDIGCVLRAGLSVKEIADAVDKLDVGRKNELIFGHVTPPPVLPSRRSHGCNRKFNVEWLQKYSWLRYSPEADGVFCSPCSMMISAEHRIGKGLLVNAPFSNWVKISDALASHTKLRYHQDCVSAADVLHETIIRPTSRIDVMANAQLAQRRAENLHILEQIVRAVCYLAKQGLALRGNREAESMATGGNPGNFLALLKEFAVDDKVLQDHLASPRVRNASYLSPQVQNEIISIMSNDIILPELISEVKESPFFSILADEVSSHNTEHLAVCLRFVYKACTLREEFVAFVQLDRVRAADVAKALECVSARCWPYAGQPERPGIRWSFDDERFSQWSPGTHL